MPTPRPRFSDPIRRQIYALQQQHTDARGHVDTVAVVDDLSQWLQAHPDLAGIPALARRYVREMEEDQRPQVDDAQLSLFEPDRLLALGEGDRVWMSQANQDEFRQWFAIQTAEHSEQVNAYAAKTRYVSSRLKAWRPEHHTLLDLEREEFGWKE